MNESIQQLWNHIANFYDLIGRRLELLKVNINHKKFVYQATMDVYLHPNLEELLNKIDYQLIRDYNDLLIDFNPELLQQIRKRLTCKKQ